MKVKCIKAGWTGVVAGPSKGDIDEVIAEENTFGALYYAFERFGSTEFFLSDHFIPLSDMTIDQLLEELVKEKELCEVN